MSGDETTINVLVDAIDTYLAVLDGPGIVDVRTAIHAWRSGSFQTVPAHRHSAMGHLQSATDDIAARGRKDLATAISDAASLLRWVPYDSYPRHLIGEAFADAHAFASLAEYRVSDTPMDFDFGLFIIGPDLLYRDHNHAAPELYAPLTGPHGFRFASGQALSWSPADRPVWNTPFRQHAIKTGPLPFLCIYAWTSDNEAPAQIIVEPDWADLEASQPPITA